jgi:hypothetical protein
MVAVMRDCSEVIDLTDQHVLDGDGVGTTMP